MMMDFLHGLSLWQSCIAVLGGGMALVVGAHFLVRRLLPGQIDEATSSLSVAIMQVVSAFIGIMLAFAAVQVWQDFATADAAVSHEAATTAELYRDLKAYGPEAFPARQAVETYVRSVLDDEWIELVDGGSSPKTRAALDGLFTTMAAIDPRTPRQTVIYGEAIKKLNEVVDYRRNRLISSRAELPGLFWAVVLVGSAVIVAYTFVTPATWANAIIIGGLTFSMGLIFVFILAVDHPFSGAYSISNREIADLLPLFEELRTGEPAQAPFP